MSKESVSETPAEQHVPTESSEIPPAGSGLAKGPVEAGSPAVEPVGIPDPLQTDSPKALVPGESHAGSEDPPAPEDRPRRSLREGVFAKPGSQPRPPATRMDRYAALARSGLSCVIGVVVVVVGGWSLIKSRGELLGGYASESWPTVEGRIVTSRVASEKVEHSNANNSNGEEIYWPELIYEYEVAGRKYLGERFCFTPVKSRKEEPIQRYIDQLPPGTGVMISYDAGNPLNSVLIKGWGEGRGTMFGLQGFAVLGGILYCGFHIRRVMVIFQIGKHSESNQKTS